LPARQSPQRRGDGYSSRTGAANERIDDLYHAKYAFGPYLQPMITNAYARPRRDRESMPELIECFEQAPAPVGACP